MSDDVRCAVCKRPPYGGGGTGTRAAAARGLCTGHTRRQLADHMRAELVRRGYPDPWREDEPAEVGA